MYRIIHCLCSFLTVLDTSNAFVLIYILVLICSIWLDMLFLCLPPFDCPVLLLIFFGLKFILYNLYSLGIYSLFSFLVWLRLEPRDLIYIGSYTPYLTSSYPVKCYKSKWCYVCRWRKLDITSNIFFGDVDKI